MRIQNFRIGDLRALLEHMLMKTEKTTDVVVRSIHFDDDDHFCGDDIDFDNMETHLYADVEIQGVCHRWLFVWNDQAEEFSTFMNMEQHNDDEANPLPSRRKLTEGKTLQDAVEEHQKKKGN